MPYGTADPSALASQQRSLAPPLALRQTAFDPLSFLARVSDGQSMAIYAARQPVFAQGDPANAIFYIHKGKVKVTVLSKEGKEAIVAILAEGQFFGEGCLIAQTHRMASATAMTECVLARLVKRVVVQVLHDEPTFSTLFISYLLARNVRMEADLVDQLFNSSEKRLARLLLLLANFGKEGKPEPVIANINQETLAEMIGTTRSRVSSFMNKFRRLGFIDYNNNGLHVHSSLLNVILHDPREPLESDEPFST
jgi:CRP/FNR family cyclic AMP-dependent transcriptional regulator